MRSFLKYLILFICTIVVSTYDCDARIKYKKATRIGMIRNNATAAEKNYTLLQNAISKKQHIKLNGTFYIKFSKPINLNYTLHVTGGEMRIVSGNCFDFVDGGGFVAENTVFRREDIDEGKALCGTWDFHSDILLDKFHFLNSKYYGRYLLQLSFEDINSDEKKFGINHILVKDSYLYNGGRVLFLNGVIWEKCNFSNNTFEAFPVTPIYLCYSHSKKRYPAEADAYAYVENNIKKSADVFICNNKFYGKPVTLDYYYCSALVESVKCYFRNNILKDIINYTKGSKLPNATCYDAYLSCAEVYFTGNTIENMMSFSMNGGNKPQCEIGKSKINVLDGEGYQTVRHYEGNTYTVDGSYFLSLGADRESLYSNVFNNFDYVDTYNWINNKIIYSNADVAGRSSSAGYGSFNISDNLFQAESITGYGLCMMSTSDPFNSIRISNNNFIFQEPSIFYLLNQVYKKPNTSIKGSIEIVDNSFVNAAPRICYFIADEITINNNKIDDARPEIDSNYYVTNYTGEDIIPDVNRMSVELPYLASGNKGNSIVNLSTRSSGTFKYSSPNLSKNKALTGNVYLLTDKTLTFRFTYNKDGKTIDVPVLLDYQKGKLSCQTQGKSAKIQDGSYSVIYNKDGILFHLRYNPSSQKLYYSLTSTDISKNDEGSLIDLQITL